MSEVRVNIKGVSYTGWTAVEVSQSLDQMCGSFGFTISDKYNNNPGEWDIYLGDYCSIEVNNKKIASGYLDDIIVSYDDSSHSIQFSGRDITAELVDCSYIDDSNRNEWKGQTLKRMVETLCTPFNISVLVDREVSSDASTIISEVTTNEGDGVAELIKKLCGHRALLPISYGDGNLTLTRAGNKKAVDSLELGKNIKACTFQCSDKERFSKYIAKGSSAEDEWKGLISITSAFGEVTDQIITDKRYRPLVILVDGDTTEDKCKMIAKYEASRRAGASRSAQYSVQGLTQSDGTPWLLNSMIRIKDSFCRINDTRLISALHFTKSNVEGEITNITLAAKESYEVQEKSIEIKEQSWDK